MSQPSACPTDVVRSALERVAPERATDLDRLDPNVDVWRELDLDSLDHVTVMELIADATGSDVAERDYPRLLSLRQLHEFVERAVR